MNVAPGSRLGQLPSCLRISVRQLHSKRPKRPTTGFQGPEGHGENIWIFGHRRSEQIIYSLDQKLDVSSRLNLLSIAFVFQPPLHTCSGTDSLQGFHDLKQIPYNGKKLKPAKLRKDYWSPFARISFPAGQGPVGRSVFQKLRELKHLHEVAWDDEFRYKRPEEYTAADHKRIAEEAEKGIQGYRPIRSKRERGVALNAQKQNSIADVAAVLGGLGRGNRITEAETQKLVDVTVSWANDLDKEYAEEWPSNVSHELFDKPTYVSKQSKPETVTAPTETDKIADGKITETPEAVAASVESKKEEVRPTQ